MTLITRGNTYWTRFQYQGELYQRSLKTTNRNEALKRESVIRSAVINQNFGILDAGKTPTLDGFRQRFLDHVKTVVAARTNDYYEQFFDSMAEFKPLASTKLHKIDESLIERFVQWRLKQDVMPATVNHNLRVLRRALRLAKRWKLIRDVPNVTLLKGERQREFVFTRETEATVIKYLAAAYPNTIMEPLFAVLIETGMRLSEALSLTQGHISFEPKPGAELGSVFIAKGKSIYARRTIPLTARAAEALKSAKAMSRCDYVFTKRGGRKPMTRHWPSEAFRAVRDTLGLPWDACLHSCRHTACTRWGEVMDPFSLQRIAGHHSVTISQRYVHPANLDDAMVKVLNHRAEQEAKIEKKAKAEKEKAKAAAASDTVIEF